MYKSIAYWMSFIAVLGIGCSELDREWTEEEQRMARLESIIEAILHDWVSPKEYGEELLESRDAAQKVWEESAHFNEAHPISLEKLLLFSYFRWEYFDRAYRLADEIGDRDTKTLIGFLRGECLEGTARPLFQDFTASFLPRSVLEDYTDERTYVRELFAELMRKRTYLLMAERKGSVPTVFPEPRGVLYLVSYRAKENALCELADILHDAAISEFDLWNLGVETRYQDLLDLRVAAAGEPLEYFRLASILAVFFDQCGEEDYSAFWWKQAFRLHSALREKGDRNRYGQIHRHHYHKMLEDAPDKVKAIQFRN